MSKWKVVKKYVTWFSIFLGILIPLTCLYLLPVNIILEPLSKFGIAKETKYLWNFFLQMISILLFINNNSLINDFEEKLLTTKILHLLKIIISVSLSLTGFITMDIRYFHLSFAAIFFLSYTAFMFWYGFLHIKYNLRRSIFSMLISILVIISSFSTLFIGYGPFEIFFISSIILFHYINNIN